ncbi:quinone-dependent dihydroorotate dehydrogenase [Halosegnis sp.]|uniref:quinone-dependent dihydroorotate dehydrogenase n=1 Tax=Halosegnis sp. TaxID=2864959 RepID=UPI0035D526A9
MRAYDAVKPALFALPPETAHGLGHAALRLAQATPLIGPLSDRLTVEDPRLAVEAFGQTFPNPVGVAAGFDKNAEVPAGLAALGFGHVEVGGVTAERQPGNPRPRMFRLPEDEALINRMGFNNEGADAVGPRLAAADVSVPIGVNIGKSKSTPLAEAADDYRYTFERTRAGGDYFVVNVSSPNTPGLRELQDREPLARILTTLQEAGAAPLLLKLSPDLAAPAVEAAVELADELGLDGIVAANTSVRRPDSLASPHRVETGGLSGAPVETEATQMIQFVAKRTDLPIVGVGGVADAEGAYEKIRAGASVVQLYTALVYEGPTVAHEINAGLLDLLERDGFADVESAIGADL